MKNSKLTRVFALVLAVMMVSTVFLFGCTQDPVKTTGENKTNNATEMEQETTQDAYEKEAIDLKGHEFIFYTKDVTAQHLNFVEVYAEGITGDKVNDAVFRRNSQLQTDYNCMISEVRDSDPIAVLREPLMAGEYVCDFIFAQANEVRNLAKSSLVVDMSSLQNMDLSKNWIDQDALAGLNMAGKVFFITGDACTQDDRRMEGMFFNIELVQAWDPEVNLYQEVRDGKWTINRMYEIVQATSQDLDGDGMVTYESKQDRYGLMAGYACDWCFVAGTGTSLSNYDTDGNIEIPLNPKRELSDVWSELKPLLTSPNRRVAAEGTLFRSGRCTFYCCNFGSLLNWSDAQYKLGIIPYPKRNEEQEFYYSTGLFSLGGYSIPVTAGQDPNKLYEAAGFSSGAEMCGYFLEAYSFYSVNTLTPAFFEQVLGKQIVTDTDSIEMMEIALEHRVYDPVVGYGFGGMNNCFDKCGGSGGLGSKHKGMASDAAYETFVSTYTTQVTKARTAVQDYLTFIDESASA